MKRTLKLFGLALLATILISPFVVVKEAEGHGVQNGSRTLVSTTFDGCVYPSTTRLKQTFETPYTLNTGGGAAKTGAPAEHIHTTYNYVYVRPYMSNYNSSCNDYRRECDKFYRTTCHRGDEDCNIFGSMGSDGQDVSGSYISYYIWINCRDVLIL